MDKIHVGEVFIISDEQNHEDEVEVIASVNVDGNEYISVCRVEDVQEEKNEDIDIFFLRVDKNGELYALEDDEEFDKVSDAFDHVFKEEQTH